MCNDELYNKMQTVQVEVEISSVNQLHLFDSLLLYRGCPYNCIAPGPVGTT